MLEGAAHRTADRESHLLDLRTARSLPSQHVPDDRPIHRRCDRLGQCCRAKRPSELQVAFAPRHWNQGDVPSEVLCLEAVAGYRREPTYDVLSIGVVEFQPLA
jgi:hypothetical protein